MVDTVDPYAQFDPVAADPYAQFDQPVTTTEDIKKTALPSLGRGAVAAVTTLPTMADLGAQGVGWLANKISGPDNSFSKGAEYLHNKLGPVTYGGVMDTIQHGADLPGNAGKLPGIGDLYNATTPGGKMVQGALEVAPSGVTSGVSGIVRGLLGGASAEGAGVLAEKYLPEKVVPWVKALTGVTTAALAPAAARKAVTPFASTQATKDAAKTLEDSGMKLTAGQATGSDFLKQREANLAGEKIAGRDASGFTGAAAGQSGMGNVPTITPEALKQGTKDFDTYFAKVAKTDITPPNFTALKTDLGNIRDEAFKSVGHKNIKPFDEFIQDIKDGVGGPKSPTPLSMTGQRYQDLRGRLQEKINEGGSDAHWWSEMRSSLDKTMAKELPDIADQQRKYANFQILKNTKLDEGKITPEGLHGSISKQWGESAYNQGNGLSPLAQAGESVLALPKPTEGGAMGRLLGAGLGYAGGKTLGALEGPVGGIFGREIGPDIVKLLSRNPATRAAYFNPLTQAYLKNQVWSPSKSTAIDPATAIKLLRGPAMGPLAETNQ